MIRNYPLQTNFAPAVFCLKKYTKFRSLETRFESGRSAQPESRSRPPSRMCLSNWAASCSSMPRVSQCFVRRGAADAAVARSHIKWVWGAP